MTNLKKIKECVINKTKLLHLDGFLSEEEKAMLVDCIHIDSITYIIPYGQDISFIKNMNNIKKLELSGKGLNSIYYLQHLTNLTSLSLSTNNIISISPLEHLTNLQKLSLSGKGINSIYPLQSLINLTNIFLSGKNITDISPLQHLKNLAILSLKCPNLTNLYTLKNIPSLKDLTLNGKKITNISSEILSQGSEAVVSYVEEKEAHKAEYLHECKLVLIGNGQVGKTSIRTKLLDRNAKLPASSTHGIDVEEWHTTIEHEGKPIKFKFNVWDFGGQGKYRAVQQFFCSRNAVYLYVTSYDDEEMNEQDDYIGFTFWYPFIQAFGYNTEKSQYSPVIHVRNKQDKGIKPLDEKEFVDLYPQIYPEFLQVSSETLYNIDKVEEAIKKVLPSASPDVFTSEYPRNWLAVKGELERLYKAMEKTITYQQYLAICAKQQMDKKNADIWLKVLDSIGTVIHFGKIEKLKDLIVLNPEWVKEAAYRVLSRADIERNYGIFKDYAEIWKGRNFEKEWHSALLELMLAFEICYKGKDNRKNIAYYVPSLFPLRTAEEAKIFDEITQEAEGEMYHFELRYKPFMPAGVLHKLIVRQNQYAYQDLRWRNCMILYNKYTFAEVVEHWKECKITLRVKGKNVKEGYRMVVNTLQHINDEIREGKLLSMLEFEAYALYGGEYEPLEKLVKKFKVEAFSFLFDEETPKIEPEKPKIMKKEYETLEKIGILYAHSSPENMTRVRPDYGVIETALKHCIEVGEVVLHSPNLTTSYSILQKELKEKHPEILHYSGHGTQEGISLYNEASKKEQPIANDLLQDIFEGRSKYLKLVFLNSCFSSAQAQIISQQGIYVLGVNEPKISNDKASELAKHFYDGIAGMEFPLSIERAIKIGCQNFALNYSKYISLISLWKDGVTIDYKTL